METLAIAILIIFVVLTAVTAVVTLLSIVGISGKGAILQIEEKYRSRLFNALLIELVGVVIAVAWTQVHRLGGELQGTKEEIQEALAGLAADRILDLAPQGMHEPSGLTHTNLSNNGNTIVMVVDDEQDGIFLLEDASSSMQVHGPIRFEYEGLKGKDPDDLEGICFDGADYFALTSHRRLGDNHRSVRRLLKFRLERGIAGQPGRGRAEELEQRVAAPGRLDQQHRLVEVIAHHRAELELHARAAAAAVADRQPALAAQVLDEHVVADDPLAVLAEVLEQVFGLGRLGLVLQQTILGLALHVGLSGQDEDLHGALRRRARPSSSDGHGQRGNGDDPPWRETTTRHGTLSLRRGGGHTP